MFLTEYAAAMGNKAPDAPPKEAAARSATAGETNVMTGTAAANFRREERRAAAAAANAEAVERPTNKAAATAAEYAAARAAAGGIAAAAAAEASAAAEIAAAAGGGAAAAARAAKEAQATGKGGAADTEASDSGGRTSHAADAVCSEIRAAEQSNSSSSAGAGSSCTLLPANRSNLSGCSLSRLSLICPVAFTQAVADAAAALSLQQQLPVLATADALLHDFVHKYETFIFDVDGVLLVGKRAFAGVAEGLSFLREKGKRLLFLTNSASKSRRMCVDVLRGAGIRAEFHEVVCSSYAVALHLQLRHSHVKKVFMIGEAGLEEELSAAGYEVIQAAHAAASFGRKKRELAALSGDLLGAAAGAREGFASRNGKAGGKLCRGDAATSDGKPAASRAANGSCQTAGESSVSFPLAASQSGGSSQLYTYAAAMAGARDGVTFCCGEGNGCCPSDAADAKCCVSFPLTSQSSIAAAAFLTATSTSCAADSAASEVAARRLTCEGSAAGAAAVNSHVAALLSPAAAAPADFTMARGDVGVDRCSGDERTVLTDDEDKGKPAYYDHPPDCCKCASGLHSVAEFFYPKRLAVYSRLPRWLPLLPFPSTFPSHTPTTPVARLRPPASSFAPVEPPVSPSATSLSLSAAPTSNAVAPCCAAVPAVAAPVAPPSSSSPASRAAASSSRPFDGPSSLSPPPSSSFTAGTPVAFRSSCSSPSSSTLHIEDEESFIALADSLDPEVGAVVVGWDRRFDFFKLAVASLYLQQNDGSIPFLAANRDAFDVVGGWRMPANGPGVAALETATGRTACCVGKPSPWLARTLLKMLAVDATTAIVCGDRLDTDIAFGKEAGTNTCVTLTGCTVLQQLLQMPRTHPLRPDIVCLHVGLLSLLKTNTQPPATATTPPNGGLV